MNTAHETELAQEISAYLRQDVEIVRRTLRGEEAAYMIMPLDRAALGTPLWKAVRDSPSCGVWPSLAAAVVGFSALAASIAEGGNLAPFGGVQGRLRELLASGPVAAAALFADFAEAGVSRYRVDRAARELGVVRRKLALRAGWIWSLPKAASA